jgi:hypothetical protein
MIATGETRAQDHAVRELTIGSYVKLGLQVRASGNLLEVRRIPASAVLHSVWNLSGYRRE